MDYHRFIERNRDEMTSTLCKHQLQKESCGFCNGMHSHQQEKIKEEKDTSDEITKMKKEYEIASVRFNHDENWSEEEYQTFYNNFQHVPSMRSKQFRLIAYKVAMILGRTRKSISWKYKYMFIVKEHPKAGKVLLEFKKRVGL